MSDQDKKSVEPKNEKKAGRVVYDNPSASPRESLHWKRLQINEDIENDNAGGGALIHSYDELIGAFKSDIDSFREEKNSHDNSHDSSGKENCYLKLAIWSCVIGYCEALATHRDDRFAFFPIPIDPLRRLVEKDFVPLLHQAQADITKTTNTSPASNQKKKNAKNSKTKTTAPNAGTDESTHRKTVRAVANSIWKRAQNKKSSIQDELHANSLYTCLCGDVDNKSLDCFGAALLVVIGMNILGFNSSCLTLSEDHAYESHLVVEDDTKNGDNKKKIAKQTTSELQTPGRRERATCEVAVPGNTKAAQAKRGREISYTFEYLKRDNITPETSWLYMAKNPVLCNNPGMVMAALVSNLNCDIDKQKSGSDNNGKPPVVSKPLYKMKRDMLWTLHDAGYMEQFPFALMELGECEEHCGSQKGMEWVDVSGLLMSDNNDATTLVLRNEKLFLDAISVSRTMYDDLQVYPYLYAGHYHKDAGRDDMSQEYRLVESLRLYAEASRVASVYRYDTKDCLQLMKHMTTVASLISKDILLLGNGKDCRAWQRRENAIAAATWLVGFFDSLLFWEEKEHSSFVEVLGIQHKHCVGKLFQRFEVEIRVEAFARIYSNDKPPSIPSAVTEEALIYFRRPRSKRLAKDSLLIAALMKGKVVVRELEMAIPCTGEGRSTRERKRARV